MRTGSKLPNPSELCPSKLNSSFNYHWHDFQTVAYCKNNNAKLIAVSFHTAARLSFYCFHAVFRSRDNNSCANTKKNPSVDPILLYTDQESVGQLGEKMGTISKTTHIYNHYWLCKTHYYMRFTEQSNNLESNQKIIQP